MKDKNYRPALAWKRYLWKTGDKAHGIGYEKLKSELRNQFTDEQFKRIHGNPRDNENECLHSVASKKFSKATRPPCPAVFQAIIASTAAQKNWGRGYYWQQVLQTFGSLSNGHLLILDRLQKECIYNWYRSRSVKLRIKRACAKKKYQETKQKRAENKRKGMGKPMYSKGIDAPKSKSGTKRSMVTTKTHAPHPKKAIFACTYCGKGYKSAGWLNRHEQSCDSKPKQVDK